MTVWFYDLIQLISIMSTNAIVFKISKIGHLAINSLGTPDIKISIILNIQHKCNIIVYRYKDKMKY